MPELPEVEIARRNLERWLEGRTVVKAEADSASRVFRGADPKAFERIRGRLTDASRRGKYLMLTFEAGQGMLMHLGMTGKLLRRPSGHSERFSRARLVLDNGEVIHFSDARLLGRIEPGPAESLKTLPAIEALGLDPLEDGLTVAQLRDRLGRSKSPLKVALMDQSRVAGLGNIHAAEALFRASLHPARLPGSLSDAEWGRLRDAVDEAIDFAIRRETSDEIEYVEEPGSENPFLVYGRAGESCGRCKKVEIEKVTQGGRTTYFCPKCQPKSVLK